MSRPGYILPPRLNGLFPEGPYQPGQGQWRDRHVSISDDTATSASTQDDIQNQRIEALEAHQNRGTEMSPELAAAHRLIADLQVQLANVQRPQLDTSTGLNMSSLQQQMAELKLELDVNPTQVPRLSLLPQQQQQVKNMSNELANEENDLRKEKLHIEMLEAISQKSNPEIASNIEEMKSIYLDKLRDLEIRKRQMTKAKVLASKFDVSLPMPEMQPMPATHKREPAFLEKKTIARLITPFDDVSFPNRQFSHVWSSILAYGRGEYLTEEEYKKILSVVLHGNAAEDFRNMDNANMSLKHIVDELAMLYDNPKTMDDYTHEIDNFTRQKHERLRKAMTRATKLISRLEPMSSEEAWPETKNNMRKAILRQIVLQPTRVHIDLEERKMTRAGAFYNLDSLIEMADEYEGINNAIPQQDMPTNFQVASYSPKKQPHDDSMSDQLRHLKSENFRLKQMQKQYDAMMEVQTAAARFKERGRSREKILRPRSYSATSHAPSSRSRTQSRSTTPFPDDDVMMEDVLQQFDPIKKDRADNQKPPQKSYSQSRPKSTERKVRYEQKSSQSGNQGYKKDYQQQPRQQYRSQNRQNRSRSEERYNKPGGKFFAPKLIQHGNKHYYTCVECNSLHPEKMVCPFVQKNKQSENY